MIKIAVLEGAKGFGGSLVSVVSLLEGLNHKVFKPFLILTSYDSHPYLKTIKDVQIHPLIFKKISVKPFQLLGNYLNLLRFMAKLAVFCKKNDINLLHFNNGVSGNFDEIIAGRILNLPIICHQRATPWGGIITHPFKKIVINSVKKFIAISNFIKQSLVQIGIPASKIKVIYPGINFNPFKKVSLEKVKDIRNSLAIWEEANIVGIVGCLDYWKGHDVFLQTMTEVFKEIPNTVALIVGDEPLEGKGSKQYLLKLVKKLGIENKVIFVGHRNDVWNFFHLMDVCVHASTHPEPFGRVIVEAMAASKPVIATNLGGPKEIIKNGYTGFLVPPNDAIKMAQKIIFLLKNKRIRNKIGIEARQQVLQRFSIEQHVQAVERVYLSVLEGK